MVRKPISISVMTKVLTDCRRRCCICYGLNRDTDLKNGQIAHLDRDSSNNSITNLAFLCLNHHDEYDSRPSQKKGLTIGEVSNFRNELVLDLGSALSQKVHFGSMELPASDPYAGQYVRLGRDADSAQIELTPLPDSMEGNKRYFVSGFALHGMNREFGPNMGDLSFYATMDEDNLLYFVRDNFTESATTYLKFNPPNDLSVREKGTIGQYGMGVTFEGEYKRIVNNSKT